MLNFRLAGGHLYGKQLFTWLSLVLYLMASFCAVLFPLDVLDEIWDVIESVSEDFLPTLKFFNLFDLLECLVIRSTSVPVTQFLLLNLSKRAVGILNLEKLFFQIFIADT